MTSLEQINAAATASLTSERPAAAFSEATGEPKQTFYWRYKQAQKMGMKVGTLGRGPRTASNGNGTKVVVAEDTDITVADVIAVRDLCQRIGKDTVIELAGVFAS